MMHFDSGAMLQPVNSSQTEALSKSRNQNDRSETQAAQNKLLK